ncbi:hypothetical protein [uncultured Phenylobacterium sp.]|uniref:hypothetical protein n=1 Tax=uncultured Phenylobacterium sp. TaxID=349273 RepID=UPI0025E85DD3|nr:hypothetical protein [uncultured Phenylobacterium sp.]
MGGKLIDRELDVRPTLRPRPGARVLVFITKDLILALPPMIGPSHRHLFAAAIVAGACTACSRAQPASWLVNETASLPRGFYLLTATPVSRARSSL